MSTSPDASQFDIDVLVDQGGEPGLTLDNIAEWYRRRSYGPHRLPDTSTPPGSETPSPVPDQLRAETRKYLFDHGYDNYYADLSRIHSAADRNQQRVYDAQWRVDHASDPVPTPMFGLDVKTAQFFLNLPVDQQIQLTRGPSNSDSFFDTVKGAWKGLLEGPIFVAAAAATAGALAPASAAAGTATAEVAVGDIGAAALANVPADIAASTAATVGATSAAVGSIQSGSTTASQAAAASSGGIINSIRDDVNAARDAVGGVLQPITSTLHDITGLVNDINDGLIKPIVEPITQIIRSYDALHTQLSRDLHDGLSGLLRIPNDIANALTSVDASIQRGMSQLGVTLADKIGDAYRSAGPMVGAEGFARLHSAITGPAEAYAATLRDPNRVTLREGDDAALFEAQVQQLEKALESTPGWIASLALAFRDVMRLIAYGGLVQKPFLDAVEDRVNRLHPTLELPLSEIMEAWKRGVLSEQQAIDEARTLGYTPERVSVMRENSLPLTALGDAIRYVQRGLIAESEFMQDAREQGYDDTQARLMLASAYSPASFGDALLKIMLESVAESGIATTSLTSEAPERLKDVARANGLSDDAANMAWRGHWSLLSTQQTIDAYFRGYISWAQAQQMLRAAGLPEELHDYYRDLVRPSIPSRTALSMVKAGIIDEGRMVEIMRHEGWREEDIELLVKLGLKSGDAATPEQADALHGLSQSTILALYDDGALDRSHASDLLGRLGVGAEAAALQLSLRDVQRQAAERKSTRAHIIARAKAGDLTPTDVQSEMSALGFSQREVDATLDEIDRVMAANDKQPSEGQLARMVKLGIIDDQTYIDALRRSGFSETWAQRLLALAKQSSTATTGG